MTTSLSFEALEKYEHRWRSRQQLAIHGISLQLLLLLQSSPGSNEIADTCHTNWIMRRWLWTAALFVICTHTGRIQQLNITNSNSCLNASVLRARLRVGHASVLYSVYDFVRSLADHRWM